MWCLQLLLLPVTCLLAVGWVKQGELVKLDCPVATEGFVRVVWVVPAGEVVSSDLDIGHKYSYWASTGSLIVKRVDPRDEGEYQCTARFASSELKSATIKILVEKIWSLWGQGYKENLIRGGVAAGITLAITILACIIYKYRWKRPKSQISNHDEAPAPTRIPRPSIHPTTPPRKEMGMDNLALEIDPDDLTSKSRDYVAKVIHAESDEVKPCDTAVVKSEEQGPSGINNVHKKSEPLIMPEIKTEEVPMEDISLDINQDGPVDNQVVLIEKVETDNVCNNVSHPKQKEIDGDIVLTQLSKKDLESITQM